MSQEEFATQSATTEQVGAEPTQEVTDVQPEVNDTTEQTPDTPTENTEEQGAEPSGAEKRIKQLTAKQREAEREVAYWKGVAEGKVKTQEPEVKQTQVQNNENEPPTPPNPAQFESYEDLERAERDYIIASAKYQIKQEQKREIELEKEAQVVRKFEERIKTAAENEPEIYEILGDRTLPISTTMVPLIQMSEVAPELIKHFHNNRVDALRIAQMPPLLAAREIGIIEARLAKPVQVTVPPKAVSQAPAPIKTVTPSGTTVVDEDSLSMTEYYKRRTKQLYGK